MKNLFTYRNILTMTKSVRFGINKEIFFNTLYRNKCRIGFITKASFFAIISRKILLLYDNNLIMKNVTVIINGFLITTR